MTRRGVLTLLLGVAIYVVAWLFGAKALYPVATGLVLAPIATRGPGCGSLARGAMAALGRRAAGASTSRARTSG